MQSQLHAAIPAGLKVIETMRAEPDGKVRLWPLHLARLGRDCAAVGFPLEPEKVEAAMARLPGGEALRVRLTVVATGEVAVTHAPLPANPAFWRLSLSPIRLHSTDPWLRVKTSHRPAYDAARAALPEGSDEAMLMNERGEVCEGTISNLFLEDEGRLLTPPLACGLLPGVLREWLIASGRAQERLLYPQDLEGRQILCGNALRGLIPGRLADGRTGS
ncbi:aminotransferase class IV family protein [Afifella pfennigii]|uniref:aminotransferase class IV family protein n=1 Tax=Afifella pfennigii TaxID=209897 RepID=UPI00047875BD|nr:aminotransferase class IV family protein [Afifella pfennigii]